MRIATTTAVLTLVALLIGCASNRQRDEMLQTSLNAYGAAMRWGDFGLALSMVHPDSQPDPRSRSIMLKRFDHIRVTGYRVTATFPGGEPDTIIQEAELRFSNRHTAVERSVPDRQVWTWDAEAERWWLTSGLPDITRR